MIEYTAQAAAPFFTGEVKLAIGDKAFTATALFDIVEIPFTSVNKLTFADYTVTVKTDDGDYAFSRMGSWGQPFYDALLDAYNMAVLRSLFTKGSPLITAKGNAGFTERFVSGSGSAHINVYEDSVVALPPDISARRVPLCFVNGMNTGDFELTLTLDTGESYSYARLGYDTTPFADAIAKQIRALREKTLAAVCVIDPSMTPMQASGVARLMPEGAAAPFGQIASIAPSFKAALESKLAGTRAAAYYVAFKELCDPAKIFIGFRKNETDYGSAEPLQEAPGGAGTMEGRLAGGGSALDTLSSLNNGNTNTERLHEAAPDPYLLWLIAPSPDGQYAAVEFAEAGAATFIYRTYGDFDGFARQLNRALEAIRFKREVIRMTDEELRKPENADYYMASKRTAALQFVRSNFTGRIIHSSLEAWKRKLMEIFNGM